MRPMAARYCVACLPSREFGASPLGPQELLAGLLQLRRPEQQHAEVEAHRLGLRKDAASAGRACRTRAPDSALSKRPTASATRASASFGASRAAAANSRSAESGRPSCCSAGAVEELRVRPASRGVRAQGGELLRPGQGADRERRLERRHEARQAGRELRVEEVAGAAPRRACRAAAAPRRARRPGRPRCGGPSSRRARGATRRVRCAGAPPGDSRSRSIVPDGHAASALPTWASSER